MPLMVSRKRSRSAASAKGVKLREEVWKKQNNGNFAASCQISWCTNTVNPFSGWDASHFVSRQQGGGDEIGNFRVCCTKCNQCMQTKSVKEFEDEHWSPQTEQSTPMPVSPKVAREAVGALLLDHATNLVDTPWEFTHEDFSTLTQEVQQKKGIRITEAQLANCLGRLVSQLDYLDKARGLQRNTSPHTWTTVWYVWPLQAAIVKTLQKVATQK